MIKKYPLSVVVGVALMKAATVGASSTYFNAVTSLNPVGYWPMHEVEAGAPGDIETNYGTLGLLGTGFYPDWITTGPAIQHQVPGALANDTDTSVFFGTYNGNSYTNELFIPHTTRASTLYPPFSVECWYNTTNSAAVGNDIWSQNGYEGLNAGPTGGGAGAIAGMRLFGSGSQLTLYAYNTGQNNIHNVTGLASNQWYHIVVTCDANTNLALYLNGVSQFTAAASTKYIPDSWMPFEVGNGRGNTRADTCYVDELAIYTNVITDIATHYTDGTSGSAGAYFHDVTNDNPVIYLRMDAPAYTAPSAASWPALTNYGSAGANGVYTPGTMPGIVNGPATSAGAAYGGLPGGAKVPQLSGVSTFADAGYASPFDPVGATPFSIAAMFRGNPADGRLQTIVGHSDNSWEINLNTTGKLQCQLGTNINSLVTSAKVYNDGNWHQLVDVYTPNSNPSLPGTNALYVDGVLDSMTNGVTPNGILPGTNLDVMIGSDPQYTNNPAGAGRQFAGQVCEVALFAASLSTNQIATLYNNSGIPPAISTQPVSASINQGAAFTNTVVVSGSGPLSFQWYQDGSARAGQTGASLVLNPVQITDASTNWYVIVTNAFGAVTSSVVSLNVFLAPTIGQDLVYTNPTLFVGGHISFPLSVSGAAPLHYQWYSNNAAIPLATNATYAITNAQPAGSTNNYYCIVTNVAGSVTSLVATVTVLPFPAASYPSNVLSANPVGFWRLNEGPDDGGGNYGATANDYWGGNDGIYTNVTLGTPGYNSARDTNGTSTEFGLTIAIVDNDVFGFPATVDFSAPAGSNAAFSVECWASAASGGNYVQSSDAGLVSKGYGGAEQFDLDCGSDTISSTNPRSHSYRFLVRTAAGSAVGVSSTVNTYDGLWHHLVGVCNESNGYVAFYIDGQLVGTNAIAPGSGILSTPRTMLIGSRPSSATSANNLQFIGLIEDVAVYNYALSAAQVQSQFQSADVAPTLVVQPTNAAASQNGTATFYSAANGTPPLAYQWYNQNSSAISGATNAALVLSNLSISANGNSYYVVVTNSFGTNQSQSASLQVISGQPQIYTDVQSQYFVSAGGSISIPVTIYGTLPIYYQWQMSDTNAASWTNMADNGRISGSSSNTLVISPAQAVNAGDYRLIATNSSGSVQSGVASLIVGGLPLGFFGNGIGWTVNSRGINSTPVVNNVLTLTDGSAGEGRSFFFNIPQYIGAFEVSYTYQDVNHGTADGVAFVLQNDSRGTAALGPTPGTGLGCNGITPGFDMDVTILSAGGFGVDTNGNLGTSAGHPTGTISMPGGDPINITILYSSGRIAVTMTDAIAQTTFSTNYVVGDLTALLGSSTALVGFTGADGTSAGSTQTISNFSFESIPTQNIQMNGHNALISWPATISSYVLQENTNLTTTNWVNINNPQNLTNGAYQVTVPAGAGSGFFRLILP